MLKKVKAELRNEVGIKLFGKPIRHMETNTLNIRQIFTLLREKRIVKLHEVNEDETLSIEINMKNYDKETDWNKIKKLAEINPEDNNEDPVDDKQPEATDETPIDPVDEGKSEVTDEVPTVEPKAPVVEDITEEPETVPVDTNETVFVDAVLHTEAPADIVEESVNEEVKEAAPVNEQRNQFNPKAGKKHKK